MTKNRKWQIGTAIAVLAVVVPVFTGWYFNSSSQVHNGSGDNVDRDKIEIHNPQPRFSSTQFIRLWPTSLGGSRELNLDNLATLKYVWQVENDGIILGLNLTPIGISGTTTHAIIPGSSYSDGVELNPNQVDGFEYEDAYMTRSNPSHEYTFLLLPGKNQHQITTNGRIFIVTLNNKFIRNIPQVSSAIEYEFKISEE